MIPTYLGNSSSTKEAPPVSILKGLNQSKRKSQLAGEAATTKVMMGTPTDRGNKASRPQGTSPMARDAEKDDDLEIESLGVIEIDGEEGASMEEDDQDSIAMAISSARKALFASASGTKSSRSNKSWKPITAKDTSTQDAVASRSATFAAETVFHERAPTPTDGDKTTSKTNECVVRMRFKLQPCNVQETLIGLLAHCLSVLQERDKSACVLNRRKTLEARRVSDLPRDFTDFYDKWGLWDEDSAAF